MARAIKEAGFTPVSIIAARRLRSQRMLREYLAASRAADASESVLVWSATPRGRKSRTPTRPA